MHPILRDWRSFLIWMAAWVPLAAVITLLWHMSGDQEVVETVAIMVPMTVVMALVCLSPFYMCRSLPLRSASRAKIATQHTAAALILVGGVMLVGRFTASLLTPKFPGLAGRFSLASPILALIFLLIYEVSVGLHYAAMEMEASRRAELLAREAQLKALKAQVNPHFLFNSLNSISALTSIDAGEARQMCIRLADFLRTSLRLGERSSIPFSEEMALTQMYLDVEQVRFGGKLRLEKDVDPACNRFEVPALIIQPLVENAVKHGVAMMAEGGEITLAAQRDRDQLRVTICNPYDPESPSTGRNGLGLRNIRDRLESNYGRAAKLEIEVEERMYRVVLTLPAKEAR
jgi:hypothetical protein